MTEFSHKVIDYPSIIKPYLPAEYEQQKKYYEKLSKIAQKYDISIIVNGKQFKAKKK